VINWQIVSETLPSFIDGLWITLLLLATSISAGLVLSIPLSVARASANPWMRTPVWLYTYVIRGTPLLVQLFIIYYGLPQFEAIRESAIWPVLRSPWFCAWLAFTLNTTAYTTEMFAGAIRATPAGEIEAARAMGLGRYQLLRDVFWPGAWRRALPQYGNEVVQMMHATALASTVTIVEILRVARDVYTNYLVLPESFGMAAVFYLTLTVILTQTFRLLERHYLRHLDPRASVSKVAALEPTHA
jgi:arginine/ornithine transport system permease protein